MRIQRVLFAAVLLALLILPVLSAQTAPAPPAVPAAPAAPDHPASPPPKYNTATEVKVHGTVESIREYKCPVSGGMGYHFVLKVKDGPIEVHVASSKFTQEFEFAVKVGEEVELIGSKVKWEDKDVILAREATHGQVTTTFRDKQGKPLW